MTKERESLTKTWKTIETATRAAELFWLSGRTAQEAADQLGISRKQLFELLTIVRRLGLVRAQGNPDRYVEPKRSPSLEVKLVDAFRSSGLQRALVLEVPRQLSCYRGYESRLDRTLHVLLGRSAVQLFRTEESGDIGVGGGRAVASFVRELAREQLDVAGRLRITPLAGGVVWPYVEDAERLPAPAALLAIEFWGSLSRSGMAGRPPDLKVSPPFEGPTPSRGAPATSPQRVPEILIFGIGNVSLELDHFVVSDDFIASVPEGEVGQCLSHLKTQLLRADRGLFDKNSGGYYYPLMEVLNTLDVVPPPTALQTRASETSLRRLRETTSTLNGYSNGLAWSRFPDARKRIAIAGGLHKTFQIRQALQRQLVSHLVVDAITCEALLRLSQDPTPIELTLGERRSD